MKKAFLFASGIGLGTGLMYLFDPDRGKRRRALIRDQMIKGTRTTKETVVGMSCDLSNRAAGLAAKARSLFTSKEADDEVLTDRVRAKLGRIASQASEVDVQTSHGKVILSGSVLEDELTKLLRGTKSVRGVKAVENRLDVHQQPSPAL